MTKAVVVLALLAAGCGRAQLAGPSAGLETTPEAATFAAPATGAGVAAGPHSANHPPVVQIRSVAVYRGSAVVLLHRPYRMKVNEHALIEIVWSDPDGDVTSEVSLMRGVPGVYSLGIPEGGPGFRWQMDTMEPHRAGLARIRAVVTDSRGAVGEATIAIHVSGH